MLKLYKEMLKYYSITAKQYKETLKHYSITL